MTKFEYKSPLDPANDEYKQPFEKKPEKDKWYSFQKMKVEQGVDLSQGNVIRNGQYIITPVQEFVSKQSENEIQKRAMELATNEDNIQNMVDSAINDEQIKQDETRKMAEALATNEDNIQNMVDSAINDEQIKRDETRKRAEALATNEDNIQNMVDSIINDDLKTEEEKEIFEDDGR